MACWCGTPSWRVIVTECESCRNRYRSRQSKQYTSLNDADEQFHKKILLPNEPKKHEILVPNAPALNQTSASEKSERKLIDPAGSVDENECKNEWNQITHILYLLISLVYKCGQYDKLIVVQRTILNMGIIVLSAKMGAGIRAHPATQFSIWTLQLKIFCTALWPPTSRATTWIGEVIVAMDRLSCCSSSSIRK